MQFGKDFEKVFFKLSLLKPKYLDTIKRGFYTSDDIDVLHQLTVKFYEKFHETPKVEQMTIVSILFLIIELSSLIISFSFVI